jgi:transmembrane sensor
MIDPVDDALIDRYVAGECSPDEVEHVRRWIGTNTAHHARIARATAVWDAARAPKASWDVDRAWDRARDAIQPSPIDQPLESVESALRRADGAEMVESHSHKRVITWPPLTRRSTLIAAAACAMIAVVAIARRELSAPRAAPTPESIVTGPRQRATLHLRDGTRVVLGPESRLVEPVHFGAEAREVELQGAAYFDVVHDPSRPFVVITRDIRIEDLGTRFAVDAYGGGPIGYEPTEAPTDTRVAVTTGSIRMAPIGRAPGSTMRAETGRNAVPAAMVVRAGDVGILDARGHITVSRAADINQYISWTTGDLTFDDTPLSEAIPRLERWYGVHIVLGDPLGCRHISATFHDESLDQVLAELGVALHARHAWSNGSVTLESRAVGTHTPDQHDRSALTPADCSTPAGTG